MKKAVVTVGLLLCLLCVYLFIQRVDPSYFIKIAETEYSFKEFFKEDLSLQAYESLEPQQRLEKIYERLKDFLCKPSCDVDIFAFDAMPVDWQAESVFFIGKAKSDDNIKKTRKALASEQLYFSHILKTPLWINDKSLRYKINTSVLPWIGRTRDEYLVEFVYDTFQVNWFRAWALRFIRDYRSIAKIYVLPYDSRLEIAGQIEAILCLKEKKSFWEPYLQDKLALVPNESCELKESFGLPENLPKDLSEIEPLAIRLGYHLQSGFESYYDIAKKFQILYLAKKAR